MDDNCKHVLERLCSSTSKVFGSFHSDWSKYSAWIWFNHPFSCYLHVQKTTECLGFSKLLRELLGSLPHTRPWKFSVPSASCRSSGRCRNSCTKQKTCCPAVPRRWSVQQEDPVEHQRYVDDLAYTQKSLGGVESLVYWSPPNLEKTNSQMTEHILCF